MSLLGDRQGAHTDTFHPTHSTPLTVLDQALDKVALAVAFLKRAGPPYAHKSEALWSFAAGTWDRPMYEQKIAAAAKGLPKRLGVRDDVKFAGDLISEAIALLRRGDGRDAMDLMEASEVFRSEYEW